MNLAEIKTKALAATPTKRVAPEEPPRWERIVGFAGGAWRAMGPAKLTEAEAHVDAEFISMANPDTLIALSGRGAGDGMKGL